MKSIKVFHLDDNKIALLELKRELVRIESAKIVVKSFSDPNSLLKSLKKEIPHLVILDIHLDLKLNGIDVCKRIRKSYPTIMIFMYSNHLDKASRTAAMAAGADDIISKQSPYFIQADHFIRVYQESLTQSDTQIEVSIKVDSKNISLLHCTDLLLLQLIELVRKGKVTLGKHRTSMKDLSTKLETLERLLKG